MSGKDNEIHEKQIHDERYLVLYRVEKQLVRQCNITVRIQAYGRMEVRF